MKKLELAFNIASIFVDAAMMMVAGILAYFLRFRSENIFPQYPIVFNLSYASFIANIIIAIPVLITILALYGLYNLKSTRKFWETFLKIAAALSTGLMIFVAIYFFNPSIFPSRLIILTTWLLAIIFATLGRYILLVVERIFLKQGIGLHRLVLIADPSRDFNLAAEISKRPELGYKIIKTLSGDDDLLARLAELQRDPGMDEILQAGFSVSKSTNEEILKFTHDHGIKFNYIPDIIESQRTNITINSLMGLPVVELNNTPLEGWGRVVKRLMDIIFSLVGIIISSPLFLIVILGIKLDSRGKILFVQDRYGQGRSFRFFKFRSMFQNMSVGREYGGREADKIRSELWKVNARNGPFLKIKNDPRVTAFGRFIRRTKLDELPQLFNVLNGDMSLVGPRAHVLEEVDLYSKVYKRQFTIKPGVTGLTQINQARIPDLPFEEEIRLDTFYLENWSLGLDFSILIKTIVVLFSRPRRNDDYY